jgi:hypothetical protein
MSETEEMKKERERERELTESLEWCKEVLDFIN